MVVQLEILLSIQEIVDQFQHLVQYHRQVVVMVQVVEVAHQVQQLVVDQVVVQVEQTIL